MTGDLVPAPEAPRSLPPAEADLSGVLAIERPHPNLMTYYALVSLLAGPFFPVPLVYLYFRYHTMRYRFDEHGVNMRWGILFHREVSLAYARIQDIHLTSNLVQRWLGLAEVKLSTASGSVSAEMTVEGRPDFEQVRDFLYSRMRGVQDASGRVPRAGTGAGSGGPPMDAVVAALRQVSADLRALRESLEKGKGGPRG